MLPFNFLLLGCGQTWLPKLNCYFLTDLQKNLEMEKRKFEKVKETLTKTEEELKDLKKVCVFYKI